jgi:hypothetical protein
MFNGIWRDLVHAGRSLAKARAFTLVCVVSLGIGMAPVIAIPYLSRALTIQPAGLNTEGLVRILTTRVGPRRGDRHLVLSGLRRFARRQYRNRGCRLDVRANRGQERLGEVNVCLQELLPDDRRDAIFAARASAQVPSPA